VILEQKGDFWNIKEFKEASDDDIEKAMAGGKKFGKGVDSGGFSPRRADGGSRGDDTNRSAAIYLAREIVNMGGAPDRFTIGELAVLCINLANDFIFPYIKDGAIPAQEPAKKSRKSSADPLAPPVVE